MPSTPKPDRTRFRIPRIPALAAVAVLLAALTVVLTHHVLHDNGLTAIDPEISGWAVTHRTAALTVAARVVTTCGGTLTLTIIATLVCAGLVWRGHRGAAVLVAVTGIGATILTVVGKNLVGRSRPPEVDRLAVVNSLSYPSGHSLGSIAVIGIIAVALTPLLHRAATRIATVAIAAIFIVAVGLSRVYLGVHWPTDVLGGWLMGALWIIICVAVYGAAQNRRQRRARPVDIRPTRDRALRRRMT
ncbi:phosphatase PAP2 family protein [Nocardia sp. NPDC050710]|uniref:phosphatase PAP2 family protein n=1 Tax=Nocardia sp. NPDC050710 TaxID=3157220 RepID=UPI0034039A1B